MKKSKVLLLMLCTAALSMAAAFGTLAYLTDSQSVTNTFTVGQVHISLDESPVGADGKEITGDRVKENTYHLIPGQTYDKDPTVHVGADSESCWVFVKVENGIAGIEAADNKIAAQIAANEWDPLSGVDNVFYKKWNKGEAADLKVFDEFKIAGDGVTNNEIAAYASKDAAGNPTGKVITVTAYAIQTAGFDDAAAAWTAGKFQ